MLIPIGDEPSEGKVAWVNYALIAANVLVFLLVQKGGTDDSIVARWAYVPTTPSLETAFTSMFLHGGWMHLIGVATGLVGGLVHGMSDASSAIPSLGASGAISGVQGLYAVAFPHNRVKLLIIWYYVMRIVMVPAAILIGLWFVLKDVIPFLIGRSVLGGGVAHGAHIGGFLSGLVLCFVLRPFLRRTTYAESASRTSGPDPRTLVGSRADLGQPWILEPRSTTGTTSPGSVAPPRVTDAEVLGLWRAGLSDRAVAAFSARLRTGATPTLPEDVFLRLSLALESERKLDDARLAFSRFLDAYPSGSGAPLAHFGLGILLARHGRQPQAARSHLTQAAATTNDPTIRDAALREMTTLPPA